MVSKKDAKSLAVVYNAYNDAHHANDNLGIRVWGDSLLKAQERTGIVLHDPYWIEYAIDQAQEPVAA